MPKSIIRAVLDTGGRVIDTPAFFRPDPPVLGSILQDMENHWPTLRQWKEEGKVRHIGVSHTRVTDFAPLEKFMKAEKPDFLPIGYSMFQQGPADRILPLARDIATAVLCTEVFKAENDGEYFKKVAGKKLPEWAADFDCNSWAQFGLNYVLGYPAITCALTESSQPSHIVDNFHAGYGRFPNEATRKKMVDVVMAHMG